MVIVCVWMTDVSVIEYGYHTLLPNRENVWGWASRAQRIAHQQGKDFEFILTVKWKLDIPKGDYLAVSFRHL